MATLVQLLDYYPDGPRASSTNSYPTNEKRQYIGQYSNTGTGMMISTPVITIRSKGSSSRKIRCFGVMKISTTPKV